MSDHPRPGDRGHHPARTAAPAVEWPGANAYDPERGGVPMRRALLPALLLFAFAPSMRADDAPPPAPAPPNSTPAPTPPGPPSLVAPSPVPPSAPKAAPPPQRAGIRWEREFDVALRRAVTEGRPVLVAVNALVDEGETGNAYLARETYASKEMGAATRAFVNFVANPTAHAVDREPDGSETCRRYGTGTCLCHQDAMRWVLGHLAGSDGAIISPYHAVLDPDGAVVYRGEFMQSCPTPEMLERFLVELSPSLALRDVWTSREAKLESLAKLESVALERAATSWLESNDPMAAAGLVALHGQESDPDRRGKLRFALARAGPTALSAIEDAVDAATTTPETDPDGLPGWLDAAIRIDPSFGALSTARAVMRSKAGERRERLWQHAWKSFQHQPDDALQAVTIEVKALLGQESVREELPALAQAAGWSPARLLRAELRSGAEIKAPRAGDRDAMRSWLYESARNGRSIDVSIAGKALARPEEEVRVAAALALRVAGDFRGVEILRAAIGDPVEGPEVRAALAKLAGGDRGEDPEAWADVLTAPAKEGVK